MNDGKYRVILLFGAPGTGKGTQGKVLGSILGFCHVSSGDMFRALDPDSDTGREFASYSSKGELVPDDLTIRLWREHMASLVAGGAYDPERELLVLDGIPRSVAQAHLMDDHIDVMRVIHLGCSDQEEMVSRLKHRAEKEGRVDDAKEDVIRKRYEVYQAETRPLLEHYPDELICKVDALGTPIEVLQEILQGLGSAYNNVRAGAPV